MTDRLTLAEFRAKYGADALKPKAKPKVSRRAQQKVKLALLVFTRKLEREYGFKDLGQWNKSHGMEPDGMVTEFPFARKRKRKYRLDFAIPKLKVGMEIHGGQYVVRSDGSMGGAHHSIEGRARDMAKGNLAAVMGWIVIEVSPKELADGAAYRWIKEALTLRGRHD